MIFPLCLVKKVGIFSLLIWRIRKNPTLILREEAASALVVAVVDNDHIDDDDARFENWSSEEVDFLQKR